MAGYDVLKTALQNTASFQNPAGLTRLKSICSVQTYAELKAELEGNFAFWNAIDKNLFDSQGLVAFTDDVSEIGASVKVAKQTLFGFEEKEFKLWFEAKIKTLPVHLREQFFELVENLVSGAEVENLNQDFARQLHEKYRYFEGLNLEEELKALDINLRTQTIAEWVTKGFFDTDLVRLAGSDSVEALYDVISEAGSDFFVQGLKKADTDVVVNDTTYPIIAKAAALRLIQRKINGCDNGAALAALASVKKHSDLEKVFEDHATSFGLRPEEQAALVQGLEDDSLIPTLQALALVRNHVLNADEKKLRMMLEATTKEGFVEAFKPQSVSQREENILNSYFSTPKNRADAQNHALVVLNKEVLKHFDDRTFQAFIDEIDAAEDREVQEDPLQVRLAALDPGAEIAEIEEFEADEIDNKKTGIFLKYLNISPDRVINPSEVLEDLLTVQQSEAFIRSAKNPIDQLNRLNDPAFRNAENLNSYTEAEIQTIGFRLVERILQAEPGFSKALSGKDGKDKASCELFLKRDRRITNLTWLTEENFRLLQKSAVLIEIKRSLGAGHKALENLIAQLPFAQQQQILKKADVYLPFLKKETHETRLREILGAANTHLSLDGLIAENTRSGLLNKIENAGLIALLETRPDLPITETFVTEVNNTLRTLAAGPAAPHIFTEDEIKDFLNTNLVPVGVPPFDQVDIESIQDQFNHNQYIYKIYETQNAEFNRYKQLLTFLLSLDKSEELLKKSNDVSKTSVNAIIQAIYHAESLEALKKVRTPLPSRLLEKLTSTQFYAFKEEIFKAVVENSFDKTVKEDRTKFFDKIKARFSAVQEEEDKTNVWFGERKTIRSQLKKIARLDLVSIQLTFQTASEEDYKYYLDYLQQLEDACDTAIPELKDELNLLTAHMQSLREARVSPANHEERDEYIQELEEQRDLVKKTLSLHEQAKRALRGDKTQPVDSFAYKGAFQVLKKTRTHQRILKEDSFSGYKITYGHYKHSEREEELKVAASRPGPAGKVATDLSSAIPTPKETTITKEKKSGSSQVIHVTRPLADGSEHEVAKFIEEPVTSGNKLTIAKFPPKFVSGETLNPDYLVACFAAAENYLLQRQEKGVSDETPIVINGGSEEEIEGLYFALQTILKKYPQGKLTEKSIEFGDDALDIYTPPSFLGVRTEIDLASRVNKDPAAKRRVDTCLKTWDPIAKKQKATEYLLEEMDRKINLKAELNTLRTGVEKSQKDSLAHTPPLKSVDDEVEEQSSLRPK